MRSAVQATGRSRAPNACLSAPAAPPLPSAPVVRPGRSPLSSITLPSLSSVPRRYYNNEGLLGQSKFKQNSNWLGGGPVPYYRLMEAFRATGHWEDKFDFSGAGSRL